MEAAEFRIGNALHDEHYWETDGAKGCLGDAIMLLAFAYDALDR